MSSAFEKVGRGREELRRPLETSERPNNIRMIAKISKVSLRGWEKLLEVVYEDILFEKFRVNVHFSGKKGSSKHRIYEYSQVWH